MEVAQMSCLRLHLYQMHNTAERMREMGLPVDQWWHSSTQASAHETQKTEKHMAVRENE